MSAQARQDVTGTPISETAIVAALGLRSVVLVGMMGAGKTSIGKDLAEVTGRKFVRVALGGVSDESEIRGHRRSYVGSLPGTIMSAMKKAGTRNPIMLLDEVDKLGSPGAGRGDPKAALLELLDPEQNGDFRDHYFDVGFDMSDVMFIVTANVLADIPGPLRNRLEIIPFSGYTEAEKIAIARKHLIPEQMKENGLTGEKVHLTDDALRMLIATAPDMQVS